MSFLNPWSLAWALPLAGAIVALYLLRMRRKDFVVPASFLWPERTYEIRANSLFQRLRFSWLLVLQLIALALIGWAFAQPQIRQQGLAGSVTAIVLDASASMETADGPNGRTRFEQGLEQVRQLISSAGPGDRLALILAGPQPKVIFPLGNDPARQRQALGAAQPTEADADVGEALRLAAALVGSTDGARLILLSDGVFREGENFSPGKAQVSFSRLGQSGENVGIQALGSSVAGDGMLAYLGVKNYGLQTKSGSVSVFADGRLIQSMKLEVKGSQVWSRTFPAPAGAKVLEAKLDVREPYQVDNYAASASGSGSTRRVLLVTKEDVFLEKALALEPRVVLDKAATLPETARAGTPGEPAYDIVIFSGVPEQPAKARGVLVFGSPGPDSPVRRTGSGSGGTFLESASHPLMEGVDLDGIFVDRMDIVEPARGGRVVADSDRGPFIVAQDGPVRRAFVSFEPLRSDFPLQVSFPIFVSNAVSWLGGPSSGDALVVQPGQTFDLPSDGDTLTLTQGSEKLTEEVQDGRALVRDLVRTGKFSVAGSREIKQVYSALRSEEESRILPRDEVALGRSQVAGVSTTDRLADVWKTLALLALLVLALEWWAFARRS